MDILTNNRMLYIQMAWKFIGEPVLWSETNNLCFALPTPEKNHKNRNVKVLVKFLSLFFLGKPNLCDS